MPSYKFTVVVGKASSAYPCISMSLTSVAIDSKILPELDGYSLCMVKAVSKPGDTEPTYNVVCSTTGMSPSAQSPFRLIRRGRD